LNDRFKSSILVAFQFVLIGTLFFSSVKLIFTLPAGLLMLVALVLVAWALISMRDSRLRISPIPAPDAVLVMDGPYKYLRHPMYTAILIAAFGLLMAHFSWFRLMLVIALIAVLLIKVEWEESMLAEKFPHYEDYSKSTRKIIPYLY
jgi:protein-S-isoprenylcysteine O-methyltransferase Ste14